LLTLRELAVSTVAYTTALVIGISAASVARSQAAPMDAPKPNAAPVTSAEATPVDPLDKYRGATDLTSEELIDLLSSVGFKGSSLKTAWAVVMRESHGHPTSHFDNIGTGDNSYGLFQINMLGVLGSDRRDKFNINSNAELLDPVTNTQAAYYMTSKGTDWGSWGLGPNAYDGTASEPAVTVWYDKFPSTKSKPKG